MPEQTILAEVLCQALAEIAWALEEVPSTVTFDAKRGKTVTAHCGRLGQHLHTLASLNRPVANALSDVQTALAEIGEQLQFDEAPEDDTDTDDDTHDADEGIAQKPADLARAFVLDLSSLIAHYGAAADWDMEVIVRGLGVSLAHALSVSIRDAHLLPDQVELLLAQVGDTLHEVTRAIVRDADAAVEHEEEGEDV
jgi:hypothetical protein